MYKSLDMSLDDIIRKNKRSRGHKVNYVGKLSGSGTGPGPDRRASSRSFTRTAPYPAPQLLFSEVGELIKHSIHYDKSGRSKGTAEVVFCRHTDTLAAIKRYKNIHLDGKPIKIELVGVNMVASDPVLPTKNFILESPNGGFRSDQKKVSAKERVHGGAYGNSGGRGSAARRRGQGDQHGKMSTKEDLDAELDKYHLEAMRTK